MLSFRSLSRYNRIDRGQLRNSKANLLKFGSIPIKPAISMDTFEPVNSISPFFTIGKGKSSHREGRCRGPCRGRQTDRILMLQPEIERRPSQMSQLSTNGHASFGLVFCMPSCQSATLETNYYRQNQCHLDFLKLFQRN